MTEYKQMKRYAGELKRLSIGSEGVMMLRSGDGRVLAADLTKLCADAGECCIEAGVPHDGRCAGLMGVFENKPGLNGLIMLKNGFAKQMADTGRHMHACLDDTAQIAGGCIRSAASHDAKTLEHALGKNFGCLVEGYGMLTVGRSLHEAFVAALVMEKCARAAVLAAPLGGAKPLSTLHCIMMRVFYLNKYSQQQERE